MESMQLDWLSGVIKMPEVHKLVNIANLFLDNFQIRVRKIDKTSTEIAKEFNRAESPYSTKKYKTFIIHNTWKGVRKAGCVVPLPSCAQGRKKRGGRHPPAPFSSLSWERLFYIIERERAAIKRWSTITGRHSWTIFQVQKRLTYIRGGGKYCWAISKRGFNLRAIHHWKGEKVLILFLQASQAEVQLLQRTYHNLYQRLLVSFFSHYTSYMYITAHIHFVFFFWLNEFMFMYR